MGTMKAGRSLSKASIPKRSMQSPQERSPKKCHKWVLPPKRQKTCVFRRLNFDPVRCPDSHCPAHRPKDGHQELKRKKNNPSLSEKQHELLNTGGLNLTYQKETGPPCGSRWAPGGGVGSHHRFYLTTCRGWRPQTHPPPRGGLHFWYITTKKLRNSGD